MSLFETSIGDTVNWQFFTLFMVAVFINIGYGILTSSIKYLQKWPFKIIGWIFSVALLYILLILSIKAKGNIQDYDFYKNVYELGEKYVLYELYSKDKLYILFQEYFKSKGIGYDFYRQIYYAITFVIIWISTTIFRANKNIVFGCFALFPWIFFGRQMRIAMSVSLIFFAAALLSMKKWRKIIGFVCFFPLLYIAYGFHGATVFLGVLLLVGFNFKNKNYIAYTAAIAGAIFLVAYLFGVNIFMKFLESFPKELTDRLSEFATLKPNYRELNTLISIQLLYILSLVFAKFAVSKRQISKDKNTAKDYQKLSSLFDAGIGMFCIVLSITLSMFCVRFIRYFTILIYMGIAIAIKNARFKIFNPFVLASIALLLLATYINFSFLDTWEIGGFDLAFYTFFVF